MAETFQVRDLFNPAAVTAMGERIKKVYPNFDLKGYITHINPKLPELTYSERQQLITEGLEKFLPKAFPKAAKIIVDSLIAPYGTDELEDANERFIVSAKAVFISKNGLDHFDTSMNALYEITKRLTSEWGVRAFFIKYPERTLAVFKKWATDKSPHVRRLVSEGSRPSLPWGKKLPLFEKEPKHTLALLELLKNDESEYVRRSVANHLNDHTKKHPDLIAKTLKRWKSENSDKNTLRLIKHALRTLLKKGHTGALEILGFKKGAEVVVENLVIDKVVKVGDYLNFSFDIKSIGKSTQPLMIDYVIYYQKDNGTLAPKVFKMTTKELAPAAILNLKKRQSFKVISTRKFHLGAHRLAIQVNGEELANVDFELIAK